MKRLTSYEEAYRLLVLLVWDDCELRITNTFNRSSNLC